MASMSLHDDLIRSQRGVEVLVEFCKAGDWKKRTWNSHQGNGNRGLATESTATLQPRRKRPPKRRRAVNRGLGAYQYIGDTSPLTMLSPAGDVRALEMQNYSAG